MKYIWRPEECTAGAVYLSRILWLDKELLEKLCYLAFFIYWFAVRRNRCLTDSCGYIFNWAWQLLKFVWMLLNIFKHTSVERCLDATFLTIPGGREELWGTHRNVSPSPFSSFVRFTEHTSKMPTETLCAGQPEAARTRCCVLLMSLCDCGAVIFDWERMGCCYALDTLELHELQLARSFLLFPTGGKGVGFSSH